MRSALVTALAITAVFTAIVALWWWVTRQLDAAEERRDRRQWSEGVAELKDGYETGLAYTEWPEDGTAYETYIGSVPYDPAEDAREFIRRMNADAALFIREITAA